MIAINSLKSAIKKMRQALLPCNLYYKRFYNFWLAKKTGQAFMAVFLFLAILIPTKQVFAEEGYTAQETVRSHHALNLKPGNAITFIIKFKNTGTRTWYNSGANFVSLATVEPIKRQSVFQHSFWEENYRPGRLVESTVAPGEVGTFRFALQSPDAYGQYQEKFQAVAKNLAWIDGTMFTIPISVVQELPQATDTSKPALSVDYPVRDKAYNASWPSGQTITINANPGEQILKTIEVKNNGSKTWQNSGSRFVSLYSVRSNYHDFDFYSNGPGWISKSQVRLASETVAPGQTGKVSLLLQAPNTPGEHTDYLRLAVEDYSWINNGEVKFVINVKSDTGQNDNSSSDGDQEKEDDIYKDDGYQAMFLISSGKELALKSGETTKFRLGFKNVGEKAWNKSGSRYVSLYTVDPDYRVSRFAKVASASTGWLDTNQVAMSQNQVLPGQLAYFDFELVAPVTPGQYFEKFRLAVEDYTWIKGGDFSLPITVVGKSSTSNKQTGSGNNKVSTDSGPMMRVGLFNSTDAFSVTSDSPFEVRTGSGKLLSSVPAKTEVVVDYVENTGKYSVVVVGLTTQTVDDHVVLQALDNDTIMEVLSYERRLPWNPAVNENLFRGSLEVRYSEADDDTWLINILPMELYLRGIAETSSSSPVEFLKVMSVAARTYATYHYQRQTKHADRHFYVGSSDGDQVYKGYALEKRHPSLVEAVIATEGEVVTYTDPSTNETKLAITPYFSWSDGRTRDWSEVWGGDVPWCKSVPVPYDVGKTLYGHGVGMSARGGLYMVADEGKTYDQVLKYFFRGIEIEDMY